jgi:hypothetical protein
MMNLEKIGLILLAATSVNAWSAPVKIVLQGVVTNVAPAFSSLVSSGDSMSASFIYDTALITLSTQIDNDDRFFYYSPVSDYTVTFGAVTASGAGGRSEVTNDHYESPSNRLRDRFILESGGVSQPTSAALENIFDINKLSVGMTLYDYDDDDANMLSSSQALSYSELMALDLTEASVSIQMEIAGDDFDWQPMFASVTEAEISVVPLPAAAWLFISAIAGLAGAKRMSRSKGSA